MPDPTPATAPVRVFVSHHRSPQEDDFTAQLVADLQGAGAHVWVDVADIHDGDFLHRINTALASTDWLVVVLTPAALRSQPVNMEVNAAINLVWQRRMRGVIPTVAQACEPTEIPPTWATLQRYDATRDYHTALAGLLQALGLSASSASAAAPPVSFASSPTQTLPLLGPAPAPAGATPAEHLTPASLYTLGFRGYTLGSGVECVLPPICPIPGGVFTMGSDITHDKRAREDEVPPFPILVGNFAIGRCPVTVAEYACAVSARAVDEPSILGYIKRTEWRNQLSHPDDPVVCVSWLEVSKYTRWLARITNQPWRLPTEAEWEKMARWDAQARQARLYPWGDVFDSARCNTKENDFGTITPVGRFPTGASPYGALDVAGNVWEWTGSLYKPYPYDPTDGREYQQSPDARVLRGGSYDNKARFARAAHRKHIGQETFFRNRGFRLALGAGT
jgi:formylglycine-generating enzyme required for sulfatase activity